MCTINTRPTPASVPSLSIINTASIDTNPYIKYSDFTILKTYKISIRFQRSDHGIQFCLKMNHRSLFIVLLLLTLIYTNPKLATFHLSALAKATGQYHDFLFFSILLYKSTFSTSRKIYLGILGNWLAVDYSVFSNILTCGRTGCKNGLCLFGECICFLGWKGTKCAIKQSDFKSLWEFAFQPIVFKIADFFDFRVLALAYQYQDCFLGIPLTSIPTKMISMIEYIPLLVNVSTKLSVLDIYLLFCCICFLWCKMIQFGFAKRTKLFDLSWYNVIERRQFYSIFLAPFWHPYTIPFLNNIYNFTYLSAIGIGYIGHNTFIYHILIMAMSTSVSSIFWASRSNGRMRYFFGLTNVITGLQFLLFFFSLDKKDAFRSILFPHFIYLFFLSGGVLDFGGISMAALVSFLTHQYATSIA